MGKREFVGQGSLWKSVLRIKPGKWIDSGYKVSKFEGEELE